MGFGATVLGLSLTWSFLAHSEAKQARLEAVHSKEEEQKARRQSKHHQGTTAKIQTDNKALENQRDKLLNQNNDLARKNTKLEEVNRQIDQQIRAAKSDKNDSYIQIIKLGERLNLASKEIDSKERRLESIDQANRELEYNRNNMHQNINNTIYHLKEIGENFFSSRTDDYVMSPFIVSLDLAQTVVNSEQEAIILKRMCEIYNIWSREILADLEEPLGARNHESNAIDNCQKARNVFVSIKDYSGAAESAELMADIFFRQERYVEALYTYHDALKMYREASDRVGEGTTLNSIGEVYRAQKNYGEALRFYEQSLAIRQEMGDSVGESDMLNNVGMAYARRGLDSDSLDDLVRAVPYIQQGFLIALQNNDQVLVNQRQFSLRNLLRFIKDRANTAEYQRQCQQTAAITGLPITEWCP